MARWCAGKHILVNVAPMYIANVLKNKYKNNQVR